jgi:hypothetical protein
MKKKSPLNRNNSCAHVKFWKGDELGVRCKEAVDLVSIFESSQAKRY